MAGIKRVNACLSSIILTARIEHLIDETYVDSIITMKALYPLIGPDMKYWRL